MLDSWLAGKPVIPGSKSITATRAAPPVDDTWIAACCPACQLPPATLNLKDFTDLAEHHGLRCSCLSLQHCRARLRQTQSRRI
jgi:hypothetical protein